MDIKITVSRLPWWSSGYDSMLPMQGTQVQSLVRELDPHAATKTQCNQINKFFKKLQCQTIFYQYILVGDKKKEICAILTRM